MSDVVCPLESSCNLWGTGKKMGPALKGMRAHFLLPVFKVLQRVTVSNTGCLLVHSIFVTGPFSDTPREKPNKTSVPSKSAQQLSWSQKLTPATATRKQHPEAAPGLCISYFLRCHTTPGQSNLRKEAFVLVQTSRVSPSQPGRYNTGACSGWLHCIPRQKAEEEGTMDHGIGLPIVKGPSEPN